MVVVKEEISLAEYKIKLFLNTLNEIIEIKKTALSDTQILLRYMSLRKNEMPKVETKEVDD